MTLRFQADADFNLKIVAAAVRREPTLDFRTADEAGLRGLTDFEVLARAAAESRVLDSAASVADQMSTSPTRCAASLYRRDPKANAARAGFVVHPEGYLRFT